MLGPCKRRPPSTFQARGEAQRLQGEADTARRRYDALTLQARLKGPYRVGDGGYQGEQEGLQDLHLLDDIMELRTRHAMSSWGALGS